MRPSEVAAQVMACVQRAQARIADRVQDIVAQAVPADDETGQHIVSSFRDRFPEPEPGDEQGGGQGQGGMRLGEIEEDERPVSPPPDPPARPQPRRRPVADEDEDWGGGSVLR
jgi:hypothetical protein